MSEPKRSSLSIMLSVWQALFLREALARISGGRARWFWVFAEPIAHKVFIIFFMVVLRQRVVAGMDVLIWVTVGMLTFFMFRRPAAQGMEAINANQSMFAYRQVRPADTVIVRAALEGFLMLLIGMLVFSILALLNRNIMPEDPLMVIGAVFGMWLFGLGFALALSVPTELVEEIDKLVKFLMMPLYLISGVIFPISMVPYPFNEWLLFNPLLHGVEAARAGFSSSYHAVPQLDLGYLYQAAVLLIFIGLAFHVRFSSRLIAK